MSYLPFARQSHFVLYLFLLGFISCRTKQATFVVTRSWIDQCATPGVGCPPILLARESKTQSVNIRVKNLVSEKSLGDLDDTVAEQVRKGRPTTIAFLIDTATAQQYKEGKLRARDLKPLRSKGGPLGQDITLDVTGLPDGMYVLVVGWITSEWDIQGRVELKTD